MPSLQQRKCPCLVVGLVVVIALGLFGYTGIPFLGKTFAGGEESPTVIRKRLPSTPAPAPTSEPAPIAPAPAPPTVGQEKPPAPLPATEPPAPPPSTVGIETTPAPQPIPEKTAPDAGAPAATEVLRVSPEKPVEAKPTAPPAARVAPKKTAPTRAVIKTEKRGPGGYPLSLLLCSHRVKEYAFASIPEYRSKGLEAHLVYTDLGEKGMWWRTLFGQYRNFEETIQVKKDLSLEYTVAVKTPFANLLGDYPSKKEAAEAGVRLAKKKGVFPYVAKGTGDAARLLVGAFPTQVQAERQQRELEGMGISARVIRR
jgi:hypothetical protein